MVKTAAQKGASNSLATAEKKLVREIKKEGKKEFTATKKAMHKELAHFHKGESKHGMSEVDRMREQGCKLIKKMAIQMQNPDLASRTFKQSYDVFDEGSGNVMKTMIKTLTTFDLILNAGDQFSVLAIPHPRGHVVATGAAVNVTTGTTGNVGRTFCMKGTPGSYSVRTAGKYWEKDTFFSMNNGVSAIPVVAPNHPGAGATCPLTFVCGNDDGSTSYIQRTYVSSATGRSDGFYFKITEGSSSTPFNTGIATVQIAVQYLGADTSGYYVATIWGSTKSVPDFAAGGGQDVVLGQIANTGAVLVGTVGTLNLAAYKTFYITFARLSGALDAPVLEINLTFSGLNNLSAQATSTYAGGGGYLIDATDAIDRDFEAYRCVSMSMLLQNRSTLLDRGGDIAGNCLPADAVFGQGPVSYPDVAKQLGAYRGDLAKGCYAWWLPSSMIAWQKWHPRSEFTTQAENNLLVMTGQSARDSSTAQIRLTVEVCAVWAMECVNRKFNPSAWCNVPQGMTATEGADLLFKVLRAIPRSTCNPSHEQWTKWLATAKSVGLGALHAAILTGKVGMALAAILA